VIWKKSKDVYVQLLQLSDFDRTQCKMETLLTAPYIIAEWIHTSIVTVNIPQRKKNLFARNDSQQIQKNS